MDRVKHISNFSMIEQVTFRDLYLHRSAHLRAGLLIPPDPRQGNTSSGGGITSRHTQADEGRGVVAEEGCKKGVYRKRQEI